MAVLLSCGLLAAASLTFLDPLLGPFLQAKFGWSASRVGLCFGVCAMVYAAGTPLAGCVLPDPRGPPTGSAPSPLRSLGGSQPL